jgi:hypothetical protein
MLDSYRRERNDACNDETENAIAGFYDVTNVGTSLVQRF